MTKEEIAQSYWRVSQAITGMSDEPIPVSERVEFLSMHLECEWEALSKACASTMRKHYWNVALAGSTSFSGDCA